MTLIPIKVLESFEFRTDQNSKRTFQYRADMALEMHPALVTKLAADGYVSTDRTAEHNPNGTLGYYKHIGLIQTLRNELEVLDIDGVEHRLIHALTNILGDFPLVKNQTAWVPSDVATAAIEAGGAQQLRWPEQTPDDPLSVDRDLTSITVTL